ncbi:MAG: hypothetical protein IKH15_09350 [Bacteroidales bacterium]|nr:hypothetical protein [Bacteroidales bacterium]
MKKKIYILTVVNEDGIVVMCNAHPTLDKAQAAMKNDWCNEVESLTQDGFVPVMKRDEFFATIHFGNGMFYSYQISETRI